MDRVQQDCADSVQAHSNSTALGVAAENDTRTEENTNCPSKNVPLAQKPHALTGTGHKENTEKHPLLLILLFSNSDFAYSHWGLFRSLQQLHYYFFTITADAQVNKYSIYSDFFFANVSAVGRTTSGAVQLLKSQR